MRIYIKFDKKVSENKDQKDIKSRSKEEVRTKRMLK